MFKVCELYFTIYLRRKSRSTWHTRLQSSLSDSVLWWLSYMLISKSKTHLFNLKICVGRTLTIAGLPYGQEANILWRMWDFVSALDNENRDSKTWSPPTPYQAPLSVSCYKFTARCLRWYHGLIYSNVWL